MNQVDRGATIDAFCKALTAFENGQQPPNVFVIYMKDGNVLRFRVVEGMIERPKPKPNLSLVPPEGFTC